MVRLVAGLLGLGAAAWGCSCAPSPPLEPCQRAHGVVLLGRVVRTVPDSWDAIRTNSGGVAGIDESG
jgi:hypothetical protein